ncbi:unnamed protein product [Haemonchus placei]|uniref:Histone deacetylase 14 n=1 Tax=Haemonchus placei TaxID=6290 RepID=A0A0N4W9F0_HAEPC|nr:unnamed protein product [Haemonchus placei]
MVRRSREPKKCASPVPDDPFSPTASGFKRAKDGNPVPLSFERRFSNCPASPSMLPGVEALPKEVSQALRDSLVPGEYYAKSLTQYLGPFYNMPTKEQLPSGDTYFILQSMGRHRETGKRIFRNLGQLTV